MRRDTDLRTADLARSGQDARGRGEEHLGSRGERVVNREGTPSGDGRSMNRSMDRQPAEMDGPPPGGPSASGTPTRASDPALHTRGTTPVAHEVSPGAVRIERVEGGDAAPLPRSAAAAGGRHAPLFAEAEAARFQSRWTDVQAAFVDEPRSAVERADGLVAEVMRQLAEAFAQERASLERSWDRGDQVTTEDLRIALQKYRSFFDRLLNIG